MFSPHLQTLLTSMPAPVILLEGSRTIPFEKGLELANVGRNLAETFPHAIFRCGSEEGTDDVFASGIAKVPGAKLEIVQSSRGAGRVRCPSSATCKALNDLSMEECRQLVRECLAANRENRRLYEVYLSGQYRDPAYPKAKYLLRDALKVSGSPALELAPASMVLLFLHTMKNIHGGNFHTIRLGQRRAMPVLHQEDWLIQPMADHPSHTFNPSPRHHHELTHEWNRQDTRPLQLQAS